MNETQKFIELEQRIAKLEEQGAVRSGDLFGGFLISRWRKLRMQRGLCIQCNRKHVDGRRCAVCLKKKNTQQRNAYRKKHGIPLNAKPYKRGRPHAA